MARDTHLTQTGVEVQALLDKIEALDLDTPILYLGTNVTEEQRENNLAVLTKFAPADGIYPLDTKIVFTGSLYWLLDSPLPSTIYEIIRSDGRFNVFIRMSLVLFDEMHRSAVFTTDDGIIDSRLFQYRDFLSYRSISLNLGAEGVETTQAAIATDAPYVTYAASADSGDLYYENAGSISYGYYRGIGYYEAFFDTESRTIRLRVYADNHITSYWESKITGNIFEGKIDKVLDATDGNVAVFDSGGLRDGGSSLADLGKVKSGTTAYWNSATGYVPQAGEIVIYTDYKTMTKNGRIVNVPGIKIGSGNGYVQDLAFLGEADSEALMSHINNSTVHITNAERTAWNNKLNVSDAQEVVNEVLIFNRN